MTKSIADYLKYIVVKQVWDHN